MSTKIEQAIEALRAAGVDDQIIMRALAARDLPTAQRELAADPGMADRIQDLNTAWAVDLPQPWHRQRWAATSALLRLVSSALKEGKT